MKKLAIFASIATLGMFTAVGLTNIKPIEVKADGEESSLVQSSEPVESSVVESSTASSSKPNTWEEIKDVKVEGKTIKEWIEGIKNEETRRSTLFALAIAVIGVVLIVLKWFTERGLLKKGNKLYLENVNSIAEAKAESERLLNEAKATLEEANKTIGEQAEKIKGLVEIDSKEREAIRLTLLEMTKDSKDFVAAGTYKKVRGFLEVKDNGEE